METSLLKASNTDVTKKIEFSGFESDNDNIPEARIFTEGFPGGYNYSFE